MQKIIVLGVLCAAVFGGGGFWGGMHYQQSRRASFGQAQFGQAFAAGQGRTRLSGAGGATMGTIIATDEHSITVELDRANATSTNGSQTGSKLVLLGETTQIGKFESGSPSDLAVGENVLVTGNGNSDGSITAQSVQIRPTTPRGR